MSDNKSNKKNNSFDSIIESLHAIAIPEQNLSYLNDSNDSQKNILNACLFKIRKILSFKACAIYIVDEEDFEFKLKHVIPDNAAVLLNKVIDECIEDGTFAWSLEHNRALFLEDASAECIHPRILHSIAVSDRVIGMFVAILEPDYSPNEATQSLISVVLSACAHQLESDELRTKLLKQNESLEKRVLERTDELNVAMQKAETAAKAKGDFLAMMSHEIRTPMNGILGMAQMLAMSDLPGKSQEQIQTIINAGECLLTILNDVLDYSKMEAGKLDIIDESTDLALLAGQTIDLFKTRADDKNIELVLSLPKEPIANVSIDPTRVQQVLYNLISNALKFTKQGYVELNISIIDESESSIALNFNVKDSGIGIKSDVLTSLFQSFTQADRYINRNYGGTGLGLSICKKLVEMMGGKIGVNSTLNIGSCFWFELTLNKVSEQHDTHIESNSTTDQSADQNLTANILLVDDNDVNLMVSTAMLDEMGFTYSMAKNGREAVELFTRHKFDLVLMDCQMPVLNGYEATQEIRDIETNTDKHVPIIALSAEMGDDFVQKASESGMDDVINKPVVYEQLYKKIASWLTIKSSKSQVS